MCLYSTYYLPLKATIKTVFFSRFIGECVHFLIHLFIGTMDAQNERFDFIRMFGIDVTVCPCSPGFDHFNNFILVVDVFIVVVAIVRQSKYLLSFWAITNCCVLLGPSVCTTSLIIIVTDAIETLYYHWVFRYVCIHST